MIRIKLLLGGALLLMLSACSAKPSYYPHTLAGQQPIIKYDVLDLSVFPQDLVSFANQAGADKALLTPQQSAALYERFGRLFFSAWEATKPNKNNRKYCWAELDRKGSSRGYAENLKPWEDAHWQAMVDNAARKNFPSMQQAGITVRLTNIRVVPTARPRYIDPNKPGKGFPFDEFQLSSVPLGFPLMVFHKSRDGEWLYVDTPLVSGWIAASDVAFVDEKTQDTWRDAKQVAFLRENVPLQGENGVHLAEASIGTVLPFHSSGSKITVLVPTRSFQGNVLPVEASVANNAAALMPLTLTPRHMAMLGNRVMGQSYGWGGLFGDRDCSGMMRDLFITFGVWLPRNSASQAKTGQVISLETGRSKEAIILEQGVPFLSLLWLPGHIGLYVGQHKGEPAFFHNIWGLRTENDGRHVLGKAVVTSTKPGKELGTIPAGMLLLDRMKTLNIMGR